MDEKEIEEYGVLRFYSDYGKHKVDISIPGDANIHEVGEAFRSFLLATGFSPETIAEILDLPS